MSEPQLTGFTLRTWATYLRSHGLAGLALFLLEASRPLHPLGEQALYLFQPFLGQRLNSLHALLADTQTLDEFLSLLNSEQSP